VKPNKVGRPGFYKRNYLNEKSELGACRSD
jgi:hypothetical protein